MKEHNKKSLKGFDSRSLENCFRVFIHFACSTFQSSEKPRPAFMRRKWRGQFFPLCISATKHMVQSALLFARRAHFLLHTSIKLNSNSESQLQQIHFLCFTLTVESLPQTKWGRLTNLCSRWVKFLSKRQIEWGWGNEQVFGNPNVN